MKTCLTFLVVVTCLSGFAQSNDVLNISDLNTQLERHHAEKKNQEKAIEEERQKIISDYSNQVVLSVAEKRASHAHMHSKSAMMIDYVIRRLNSNLTALSKDTGLPVTSDFTGPPAAFNSNLVKGGEVVSGVNTIRLGTGPGWEFKIQTVVVGNSINFSVTSVANPNEHLFDDQFAENVDELSNFKGFSNERLRHILIKEQETYPLKSK